MNPSVKELRKIHAIGNSEWFNFKFKGEMRIRGDKFSRAGKIVFAFLCLIKALIEEKTASSSWCDCILGNLRGKKSCFARSLSWVNEVISRTV